MILVVEAGTPPRPVDDNSSCWAECRSLVSSESWPKKTTALNDLVRPGHRLIVTAKDSPIGPEKLGKSDKSLNLAEVGPDKKGIASNMCMDRGSESRYHLENET